MPGTPLGHWWQHGLAREATCPCGHRSVLFASELIPLLGARTYLDGPQLRALAARLKCQCGRRGQVLRVGRF